MKTYVAAAALVVSGVLALSNAAGAATTCDVRLADRAYTCTLKSPSGEETVDLSFSQSPFSVSVPPFSAPCVCDTDGPFKNPKFEHSPSKWTCLGAQPGGAVSLRGTVSPAGKLTKVSGMVTNRTDAVPLVLDCDLLPAP